MTQVINRRYARHKAPIPPGSGTLAATSTVQSLGLITMCDVAPLGAIPSGNGVQVGNFPTQTDVLNTWPSDGSVRHYAASFNATSTGAKTLSVIPHAGGSFAPTWPSASVTITERANNALLRYSPILTGVGTGGVTAYAYRSSAVSLGGHESFPSRVSASWLILQWNAALSGTDKIRVQDAIPAGSVQYRVYGRTLLNELFLSSGTPSTPAVSAMTASGRTATATTGVAHNLAVGDRVTVSGCTQTAYNGVFTLDTVPSSTTFTYTTPQLEPAPASPATGSPVITYFIYFDTGADTPTTAPKTSTVDDPGTVWTATLPAFDGTHTSCNGAICRRAWVRVTPMNGGTPHPDLRVKFEVTSYAAGGHVVDATLSNIRNSTTIDEMVVDVLTTLDGGTVSTLTKVGWRIYVGQMFHGRATTGLTEAVVLHDFEPWILANVIPRISPTIDAHTYDLTAPSYQLSGGYINPPTDLRWFFGEAEGWQQSSENAGRQELNPIADWEARLFGLNTEAYRLVCLAHGSLNGGWTWQCSRASDDEALLKITEDGNGSPGSIVWTGREAGGNKVSGLLWHEQINGAADGAWRGAFDGQHAIDGGTYVEREHMNELVFVPYLLTGEVFYLDLLRYQGGWTVLAADPSWYPDFFWTGYAAGRNGDRGEQNGTGMHRGFGKPLTKICRAAWAMPDAYAADQSYFHTIVQNNLEATARYQDYLDSRGWDGGTWATFTGFTSNATERSNVVTSTTGASQTVLTVIGDGSGVGIGTNDHGLQTGDYVALRGFSGGAGVLNAYLANTWQATRIDATHFSVPVNTTGFPTTNQGTWASRTGFYAPPWSVSDAARVISWIGYTGLWTMTASMWAFPDRVARAGIALMDQPTFDTTPGTSYQYAAIYGYVVGSGYHFANSWTEFREINNNTTSNTAPLLESEATYTGVLSPTHRGTKFFNDPGFNTYYTIYINVMTIHAVRRAQAGATAALARLVAAADVLPELKRRAGFFHVVP